MEKWLNKQNLNAAGFDGSDVGGNVTPQPTPIGAMPSQMGGNSGGYGGNYGATHFNGGGHAVLGHPPQSRYN